jgi:DNA-binding NarL/FixJ family response regulator
MRVLDRRRRAPVNGPDEPEASGRRAKGRAFAPADVLYSGDVAPRRLLVVGEDALARAGLRALAESAGLRVAADVAPSEVGDLDDDTADAGAWDVGASGGGDGLRALAARLPVVAILWSDEQAGEALAAGARAVLLREQLDDRLLAAVNAALAGLVTLDEGLAESVLRPRPTAAPALAEPLTPREIEVVQLLAEGLTNRRIGERLGISEHTAKFHVNAILGKLGASSRGEAVAQAARLGLVLL